MFLLAKMCQDSVDNILIFNTRNDPDRTTAAGEVDPGFGHEGRFGDTAWAQVDARKQAFPRLHAEMSHSRSILESGGFAALLQDLTHHLRREGLVN